MNEEPHAHEKLVAKARRPGLQDSDSGSTNSLETVEESLASFTPAIVAKIESSGDPPPPISQPLGIYLLEPLILILLFAYNFSCKFNY